MVSYKINIIICSLLALTAIFTFFFTFYKFESHNNEMNSPVNITIACNRTEIEEAVECIVNDVSDWFIFNITNQKTTLDDNELKKQGGVCWHYARYYERQFKAIGFEAKTVNLDPNDEWAGHRFTLVWNYNRSRYCIIDQRHYECFRMVPTTIKELDSLFSVNKTL